MDWAEADGRLRRSSISGYFSPEEREARWVTHRAGLAQRLGVGLGEL